MSLIDIINRRCRIPNCHSLVKKAGAYCSDCTEKLCDDNYKIIYCPYCRNIIKLEYSSGEKIPFNERFHKKLCGKCETELKNDMNRFI